MEVLRQLRVLRVMKTRCRSLDPFLFFFLQENMKKGMKKGIVKMQEPNLYLKLYFDT